MAKIWLKVSASDSTNQIPYYVEHRPVVSGRVTLGKQLLNEDHRHCSLWCTKENCCSCCSSLCLHAGLQTPAQIWRSLNLIVTIISMGALMGWMVRQQITEMLGTQVCFQISKETSQAQRSANLLGRIADCFLTAQTVGVLLSYLQVLAI